jgi:transglutaminase-like putative cysteine protease
MKAPGIITLLPFARTARPMSRDKADSLLLLTACALVLAPHVSHLPIWISVACGALLLWRGWVTFRGNRMPPRWLLLPLAALSVFGIYRTFHTLFGREPGVALVVLLLSFKLLEMRARRDLFVVTFLSFFVMLTNFFYSQSIGIALLMAGAVILMLTAQLSFQYTGAAPPLKRRLGLAALIFGLAVPLTLILFLLFPRIQGPLWGLPGDAQGGKTGLSDSMAPGDLTNLALSGDIAFRVNFTGPPPPKSRLYWRGPVFGNFDGRTWTQWQPSATQHRNIPFRRRGDPLRYQVTIEPTGRNSIFALDFIAEPPRIDNNPVNVALDLQLLTRQPVSSRVRYEASSFVDADYEYDATPEMLRTWLRLPPGYNPATLAFAQKLRGQFPKNDDVIPAVLRYFREEKFRYTLEPPELGRHSVDDFLFNSRAGFCEHYASSFVILMRSMKIPARVVTGYQGGEFNGIDGFFVIRQSDAHAWAEVWLEQRGWVRVDPTAAVAPERIETNLAGAAPTRLLGGLVTLDGGSNSWLGRLRGLRQNWDALSNAWNQWVLDYTPDRQRGLLESLGLKNVDWATLTALMFGLGGIVVLAMAIPLTRNRPKRDPVGDLYQALCRMMAAHGFERAVHEGPRDYGVRITGAGSALPPGKKAAVARFLEYYETLRYCAPPAAYSAAHPDRIPPAALSHLKSLLAQCR